MTRRFTGIQDKTRSNTKTPVANIHINIYSRKHKVQKLRGMGGERPA